MPVISGAWGGRTAFVGALISLSAAATGLNSNDNIPFDTVISDAGGFFNAVGGDLVVPAGQAGFYYVGASLIIQLGAGDTRPYGEISSSGPASAVDVALVAETATVFTGSGGAVQHYAVGDSMFAYILFTGASTITVRGGVGNSFLYCAYLGA